jgi:hypothetical protein
MKLVYYTPHRLYENVDISSRFLVERSFSEMFNPSISLLDRSKSICCPPIDMEIIDPLPVAWKKTDSFENLCNQRISEIFKKLADTDKNLVIFYSGGIDSTLIVAMVVASDHYKIYKEKIFLAYSEESIRENPKFWYSFLLKEFSNRLLDSTGYHSHLEDENNICITGEFADNIFGSLTLKSYMDNTGDFDATHKPFRSTGKDWMLNKISNRGHRDSCEHMIEKVLSTSPQTLTTNHECLWWLNFILKWQAVKFRMISHSPSAATSQKMYKNVIHFFETEYFQQWAVTTDEKKVDNSWFSYKLPAKKIIYNINKDEYYYKWKTKYPSIPGLTRYANTYNFIYKNSDDILFFSNKLMNT